MSIIKNVILNKIPDLTNLVRRFKLMPIQHVTYSLAVFSIHYICPSDITSSIGKSLLFDAYDKMQDFSLLETEIDKSFLFWNEPGERYTKEAVLQYLQTQSRLSTGIGAPPRIIDKIQCFNNVIVSEMVNSMVANQPSLGLS